MTDSPELAEQVAEAVRTVPGVHDLYGGLLGEVATYLPGRRVVGVRLTDEACAVHIVTTGRQPWPRSRRPCAPRSARSSQAGST